MKRCYHQSCDTLNEARKNEERYKNSLKFLTKTTQALVLTIHELTTEFDSSKDKYSGNYNHSTTNNTGKENDPPFRRFSRG